MYLVFCCSVCVWIRICIMIEHRNPGEYSGVDLAILQALGEGEFVQWSDVHSFYAVRAIRSTQMSNCNPLQN